MPTKVFWSEPTGECDYYFRRYSSFAHEECKRQGWGFHNAETFWYRGPVIPVERDGYSYHAAPEAPVDAKWPEKCEFCNYQFWPEDHRMVMVEARYRNTETGQEFHLRDAPPGAMWDATWFRKSPHYTGPDGITLVVVLPNGDHWMVDSEARNCTKKGDLSHKCWIRHGDPRTGQVHVDKNGVTCEAGAGSIMSGNYHGFLQNGYLTDG